MERGIVAEAGPLSSFVRHTLVVLLVLGSAAAAAASEPSHASAEPVTDAVRLPPGGTVRVGVRIRIDPGWHIYWSNPGDAGLATDVRLELPDGWSAGPLEWPAPKRFEQPGGIAGFGYEDEVVLAHEVNVPSGARGSVRIPVTASWLACREVCVLGEAHLEARIPAPASDAETGRRLLDGWARRLPTCDDTPVPWDVTVRRSDGGGAMTIWLRWAVPVRSVTWFPEALEAAKLGGGEAKTKGNLTRIDLTLRPIAGRETAARLPSVVVWTDDQGARHARCLVVEIAAGTFS